MLESSTWATIPPVLVPCPRTVEFLATQSSKVDLTASPQKRPALSAGGSTELPETLQFTMAVSCAEPTKYPAYKCPSSLAFKTLSMMCQSSTLVFELLKWISSVLLSWSGMPSFGAFSTFCVACCFSTDCLGPILTRQIQWQQFVCFNSGGALSP